MTDRIIDLSEQPASLKVRNGLLVVELDDGDAHAVPLEDLAAVVVSHPRVRYTQSVLAGLAEAGGAFIACNAKRLPVAMLMPLEANYVQAERFGQQAAASKPLQKLLWKQIVQAKIRAQAKVLREMRGQDAGLAKLVSQVRSGDPRNLEARAARLYWPALFDDQAFRRGTGPAAVSDPEEDSPLEDARNHLLNYGYAVLRAIVARAVCAAGLHPSLGIHHHNRYNAYCLADDLMEPYRPIVDRAVAEYLSTHDEPYHLEAAAKQHMIADLTGRYEVNGQQRTLFDAAARMASSLADVFLGNAEALELPDW